ncbi:MAG: hypothetical protein ACKOU6_05355 [Planctomycetota bacterium]
MITGLPGTASATVPHPARTDGPVRQRPCRTAARALTAFAKAPAISSAIRRCCVASAKPRLQ